MKALLLDVGHWARRAGEAILQIYGQGGPEGVETRIKEDQSPVTAADLAAERVLADGLSRLKPGAALVSEESVGSRPAAARLIREAPWCWLVDPLDGTRDFLARTGDFTVNVALLERGTPVLGVILAPARGVAYLAARGEGAFRQREAAGALEPIRGRARDREAFTVLVSRFHAQGEEARLQRLFPRCQVRAAGSALKYGLIAEGAADLAIRLTPTAYWDTAAAQCVLEHAGGAIVDLEGRPLTYEGEGLINPPFVAVGDRTVELRDLVDRFVAQEGR